MLTTIKMFRFEYEWSDSFSCLVLQRFLEETYQIHCRLNIYNLDISNIF